MALSKCTKFNAKEVLNGYKNNKCRLCGKMFCCPDCRMRHEGTTHDVNVNCSLCIYGFGVVQRINNHELVEHVIDKHLLSISRCAYCETNISTELILSQSNKLCTVTNFTDEEINEIWKKLPQEVREENLNCCYPSDHVEKETKNSIKKDTDIGPVASSANSEEDQYDSPKFDASNRRQLFEEGHFANSTPVLDSVKPSNIKAVEVQINQTICPSNDNFIFNKLESNMEDSIKTRKVHFNETPQPMISKSPSSFHVVLKTNSIMKNKIKPYDTSDVNMRMVMENSKISQSQNNIFTEKLQLNVGLDKSLVEVKKSEKITVPVKPTMRDLNTSSSVSEFSKDESQSCHWITAVENLLDSTSENFKSAESLDTNSAAVISRNNNISDRDHSIFEKIPEVESDLETKGIFIDLWAKCKSKIVEFTRTSIKRPRSELDSSVDVLEDEQISTPMNEYKRRRLNIKARRPIHHYVKPEVKRDVKKINRGMQTSLY